MTTTVAKRLPDGSLVQVLPDGTTWPLKETTDWAAVDALTDEQIMAAAFADPDAQPLSEEALARARQGPPPRVVRHRLRLSREEFCARYQIPMDDLVAWETRMADPGPIVRAYMKVIMADPEAVARTIAYRPERPTSDRGDDMPTTPRAAE